MPNQDLIEIIKYHLSQGESRKQVEELLVSEGWRDDAVNEVFESLPKPPSFWQQLPIYPYFEKLDAKTAQLPAKVVLIISGILIALVLVIGFILYFSIDPITMRGSDRDIERAKIHTQLQAAIKRFYEVNRKYPVSLSDLVPNYIYFVPVDPKTKKAYDYAASTDGSKYSLCVLYETKSPSDGCVNTEILNVAPITEPPY